MSLSATVTTRFVEMTTDEEYMAWRAALSLLWALSEQAQAVEQPVAIDLSLFKPTLAG